MPAAVPRVTTSKVICPPEMCMQRIKAEFYTAWMWKCSDAVMLVFKFMIIQSEIESECFNNLTNISRDNITFLARPLQMLS